MRCLRLAPLALLIVACDQQPVAPDLESEPAFAATSDWSVQVLDLPAGDVSFYCAAIDDWLDEVGLVELSFHTVESDGAWLFFIKVRNPAGFHLVGDVTGIWHRATGGLPSGSYVERGAYVNGSYHLTYNVEPFLYVNETSGTTINFPLRLNFAFNANGEVKVVRVAEPCSIVGN